MSSEVWIGDDHLKKLQAVAESASDYFLATNNVEFAAINGGLAKLREILFAHTQEWERFMSSISED